MIVSIHGLGLATPKQSASQEEALALTKPFRKSGGLSEKVIERLYRRSGVERRSSVLLEEINGTLRVPFFENQVVPPISERMSYFNKSAGLLASEVSQAALEESGFSAKVVSDLITVTCTGFSAPGFEHTLYSEVGISPDVERFQLGFMGCHAGINALRLARARVSEQPERVVLIVLIELCSLHYSHDDNPERQVSNAIFSDGAAALVVAAGKGSASIESSFSKRLIDTESFMSWKIGDSGFLMGLSPKLPAVLEAKLKEIVFSGLNKKGYDFATIKNFAVHPGGLRILRAVEQALSLQAENLSHSYAVLENYGNMSSPTLFFILKRLIREQMTGATLLLGFGPGLSVEGLVLDLSD